MSDRPSVPEGWEFRLSHDRRLFAFYDPGNGPWFVPEPSMQGRFVDSADMDRLDWYRYVPAPDKDDQPIALTPCVHVKALHETEHAGLIVEGCPWCSDREQLGTPEHSKPLVRVTTGGARPIELTDAERAMLRYAIGCAREDMDDRADEFDDDDLAALESLRRLAGTEEEPDR